MPGVWELLIILAIVLLLFGGKRLKNIGGDLGSAIKGFKKSMNDDKTKPQSNIAHPNDEVIDAEVVKDSTKNANKI